MQNTTTLKSEDKLLAALAHGSALLPFWGIIGAVIIWLTQRKGPAFVRFHSLQAVVYQVMFFWAFTWLWPLLITILLILLIVLMAAAGPDALDNETAGLLFTFGFQAVIFGSMLAAFGLYVLMGLIGAGFSLAGREFRYPLFGRALAKKLGYSAPESQIEDEQEDQVAAAIGHSTAILLLVGAILPLVLWVTQKERSRFLGFQSLQAAIYQGLGAVAYLLGVGLYLVSFIAFFAFGLSGALEANSEPNMVALALIMLPMLCFMAAITIGGPLFHLFAAIASLRVLRGHDYSYPLLGKFIRRRIGAEVTAPPATGTT